MMALLDASAGLTYMAGVVGGIVAGAGLHGRRFCMGRHEGKAGRGFAGCEEGQKEEEVLFWHF
jgi:hypothetical protein